MEESVTYMYWSSGEVPSGSQSKLDIGFMGLVLFW